MTSVSKKTSNRLFNSISEWFSYTEVQQLLFWIVVFSIMLYFDYPIKDSKELAGIFTSLTFYAAIVYINLYYLFPNYLNEKKIGIYIILFLLVAVIITPIRSMVLYWIFNSQPDVQRNLLNIQFNMLVSHVVVGAGSTMYKIASDWTQNSIEKQKLEAENLQSELRFLRSQINPHFLFNTLNSLYALTLKKSDAAPTTVLKLSEIMRYMLYESNSKFVPLNRELEYIKNYVALERLRHGENADIKLTIEGDITDQVIAPMILLTFLENSFKHGLSKGMGEGYVYIHIIIYRYEIRFHLSNNLPSTQLPNSEPGGIGLINVNRRLELLYPGKHQIEIEEKDKSYNVDLLVNLSRTNLQSSPNLLN